MNIKNVLLVFTLSAGLIQAMERPAPQAEAAPPILSLTPDVKRMILGTLVFSGGSLKGSIENIIAFLWTHPQFFNLVDENLMNNIIVALGDRWVHGNYKQAEGEFESQLTHKKGLLRDRMAGILQKWGQDYRNFEQAYRAKDIETMKKFIDKGIPYTEFISVPFFLERSPLEEPLLEALISAGANPQKVKAAQLLHDLFYYTKYFNEPKIKELIKKGANINARGQFGETPLIDAAIQRTPEALQLLISRGADINAQNYEGNTALMNAINEGQTANVRILIAAGANVNIPDNKGRTALKRLNLWGGPEIHKTMLKEAGGTE